MKLTVLGCAGTYPGPVSPCSSYLLEADGFRLVLDMGNGSLGPLQQHVGLLGVDAVIVSHLHGDHCLDLVAYSYARRYHPQAPLVPLPVYGPRATRSRLCGAFDDWPINGLQDVYEFRDVQPGQRAIGPFDVTFARMSHPIEAYGVRVAAEGRILAYSGDTAPCENLEKIAAGADLFLCEASWYDGPDNPPGVHLSGRQAGEAATAAGASRLLLTHIVPWVDPARIEAEAAGAYEGELARAELGRSYEV